MASQVLRIFPVSQCCSAASSISATAARAAAGVAWFHGVAAAAGAMAGEIARETEPCAHRQARYAELLEIYRDIYPKLPQTYGKLARFAAKM